MLNSSLPISHYAYNWPRDKASPVAETNALGIAYANTPEGAAREELLLDIVRSFHPYLMKYLGMILHGHASLWGNQVTADTKASLRMLIPSGEPATKDNLLKAVHSLHLSFKGMDAGEMYDSLAMVLMEVVRGYDPNFSGKVEKLILLIGKRIGLGEEFTLEKLHEELGYDPNRAARLLCRRDFLVAVPEKARTYVCNPVSWPPPAAFSEIGPIGFTYYVQTYFRYGFDELVNKRRRSIESNNMLQLQLKVRDGSKVYTNAAAPDINGWRATDGNRWAADTSMMTKSLDASSMDLAWVEGTKDPLFSSLSREDRMMLHLLFVVEATHEEVGRSLGMSVTTVKSRYVKLILRLRAMITGNPEAAAA